MFPKGEKLKEKIIPNFPEYKIREDGKVFSRYKPKTNKVWDKWTELKPVLDRGTGYLLVTCVNRKTKKRKNCFIHRLLAEAFIPNPDNKPQVNHKDGVKTNNALNNLEWVTAQENTRHAIALGLSDPTQTSKAVIQKTLSGEKIAVYSSIREASKITGIQAQNICKVLKKKRKTAGNFIWEYKEGAETIPVREVGK